MDSGFGTRAGLVLVVAGGIVIPGVANYFLSAAGYGTLGSVLWAFGYGTMVILLWYGWVRPLELTGPDTSLGHPDANPPEDESTDSGDEGATEAN